MARIIIAGIPGAYFAPRGLDWALVVGGVETLLGVSVLTEQAACEALGMSGRLSLDGEAFFLDSPA